MKPPRSLKARALHWLAQREQSRVELRRRLLPLAMAEDGAAVAAATFDVDVHAASEGAADSLQTEQAAKARVEAVLDWLEANQYLSHERFVDSRVHARAERFGNLRIRQELKLHQLALSPEASLALEKSELQRASTVRDRKFGIWPPDAAARAKQARFLAQRGFSPDVIGRILRRRPGVDDDGGS